MPQSFHYVNKELELSDAQHWMEEVRQAVRDGESDAVPNHSVMPPKHLLLISLPTQTTDPSSCRCASYE